MAQTGFLRLLRHARSCWQNVTSSCIAALPPSRHLRVSASNVDIYMYNQQIKGPTLKIVLGASSPSRVSILITSA
jgi:hypothetical protein